MERDLSMDERALKVRFNLQNWLKEEIDESDYRRIGGALDIDENIVRNLVIGFSKSVARQAGVLDEEGKYSEVVDKARTDKVIFVGDSITSDRESFAKIIRRVFTEHGLEFIDASVSGWRTTEFLDDFYFKVLAREAQAAHVMLGTNGMRASRFSYGKCNVSPSEFEKNMTYILTALCEQGAETIVSTLPPYDLLAETYDTGNWTVNKSDYDEYNEIIAKSAQSLGCVVNDMRDIYSKYEPTELLEEDGVHLNKTGHYILAEQVIEKMIKILNK